MRARSIAALVVALGTGCAQMQISSEVEIIPKDGAKAVVIGAPASALTARGATATWEQKGNTLEVVVQQTRRCAVLRHEPVVRVERITKKVGSALYWEFGIGGALLVTGLIGLIRPDLFGQTAINSAGESVKDTSAGYRIGGIFTGLAAVAIAAGTYDAVRSRDEIVYTDAYRPHVGEAADCDDPERPLAGRQLEMIVGEWTTREVSDDDGHARFLLPDAEDLPHEERDEPGPGLGKSVKAALTEGGFFDVANLADVEPASTRRVEAIVGKDGKIAWVPESRTVSAVLRLGGKDAVALDFVAPYESVKATGHRGEVVLEPQPINRPPPRPKVDDKRGTSDKADGASGKVDDKPGDAKGQPGDAKGQPGDAKGQP